MFEQPSYVAREQDRGKKTKEGEERGGGGIRKCASGGLKRRQFLSGIKEGINPTSTRSICSVQEYTMHLY